LQRNSFFNSSLASSLFSGSVLWPAASPAVRSIALGEFLYVALGINTVIEGKFFTHFFDGKLPAVTINFLLQGILVGAALGLLFGKPSLSASLPHHSPVAWAGRGLAAWLSWPLVYLIFGMCVAPIVLPYYNAGIVGLKLPHLDTVLEVQLLRSVIFLVASLPFIALWKGSRRSLWFALGLTHAVVVGIYGMVGATFFPIAMRVAHSLEMTCDGFAYAGLLVLLFAAPAARTSPSAPSLHTHQPHAL
jgi:hypothetical protein